MQKEWLLGNQVNLEIEAVEGKAKLSLASQLAKFADCTSKVTPYNLLSVLKGTRFHFSIGTCLCSMKKVGGDIVAEFALPDGSEVVENFDADQYRWSIHRLFPNMQAWNLALGKENFNVT